MRVLGIDYGDKKVGLAFGDTVVGVAVPLDVAVNDGTDLIQRLQKKITSDSIECVVVGIPLSQGGHHSPAQLEKTRAFIAQLQSVLTIPVYEEDESFTTSESIRLQREEGAQAQEDALAAMLITQAFIDRVVPT
jgi:putative Holliday junction resolvase